MRNVANFILPWANCNGRIEGLEEACFTYWFFSLPLRKARENTFPHELLAP
jgi:hypothetical protein